MKVVTNATNNRLHLCQNLHNLLSLLWWESGSKIKIWSERKKLLDSWQETLTCSYHSRPISSFFCLSNTVFNFSKENLPHGYVEVGCWEVILELKPSLHATIWATSWMRHIYLSWQIFFRQHFIISSIAKSYTARCFTQMRVCFLLNVQVRVTQNYVNCWLTFLNFDR